MKIAIFETEHFEGAFPVIKLFDKPGNEVTIHTSEETYKRFKDLFLDEAHRYQWSILPVDGRFRFFYSLYKALKKNRPDILYINTISNNHLLYALVLWLLPVKRVVMTVHDINCLFQSRFSWKFRQAIIHWGKRWLLKEVDEFNVVADTMIPYLKKKANQKRTHNVPGAVFENKQAIQTIEEPVRVVIPGSLDGRRRDYEQVFALAALAHTENFRLRLILLGGFSDAYGEKIVKRANTFPSDSCEIDAYGIKVVDQDEFDRQMDAAHFIFIPSVIDTKICGDIPEIYGITKSSGNIFDVIKHAQPFSVPARLTISPDLQTSCYKYTSVMDIITFLKSFTASPTDYTTWQQQALENSRKYSIEKMRERNGALFK